jgi:type VI secretion system protein ImpL
MKPFFRKKTSLDKLQEQALGEELKKALDTIDTYKPRVLLIGPHGAGKTQLLAQSGLDMHSPFNKTLKNCGETVGLDWWEADEAVFIDPAGKWCFNKAQLSLWQTFLHKMKQKFSTPFQSVCLVLDLRSLARSLTDDTQGLTDLLDHWRACIHSLLATQDQIILNIVITHCDYLSGYAEFFSILDQEQQQQPLGFSLDHNFHDTFTEFVSLVNRRLLNRLHYEPNHDRRLRIHDFPMQLNCLEKPLTQIIQSLPNLDRLHTQHIFFCSSHQSATTMNLLGDDLSKLFPFLSQQSIPLVADDYPLFIQKMLPQLINSPIETVTPIRVDTKPRRFPLAGYSLALVLLILLTSFLHQNFEHNTNVLNAIQNNLIHLPEEQDITERLMLLKNTEQALSQYQRGIGAINGFKQASWLRQEAKTQYQHSLKTDFSQYLNEAITNSLKENTAAMNLALYTDLKIYLSLGKTSHDEPNSLKNKSKNIISWYTQYWLTHEKFKPEKIAQLNLFLQDYLQAGYTITLDKNLVDTSQAKLKSLPVADLAYAELVSEHNQITPIETDLVIDGIDLSAAEVPALYSVKQIKAIYTQAIPELAKQFGDLDSHSETELVTQLRQTYIKHYLLAWQNALSHIRLVAPTNYEQASNQLNLFINAQSPFIQLYQRGYQALLAVDPEALGSNTDELAFSKLPMASLQKAQAYLDQLNNAASSIKMAFDETTRLFQDPSASNPLLDLKNAIRSLDAPLKTELAQLIDQDNRLLLRDSTAYINTLWQENIYKIYQAEINHHFPIDPNAKDEIGLDQFNQFFGPGGLIQNFFNQNLRPFIDLSKRPWGLKTVNGLIMPLDTNFIEQMERASFIQKMFYTRDLKHPSLAFSLTPVRMNSESQEFTLNIGGQMIHYLPGLKQTMVLRWPGPDGTFITQRFTNQQEKNPTATYNGNFAWLRLVYASHLTPSKNPRQFEVTFTAPNCFMTYLLVSDNPINPYLPDLLTTFKLPEQLNKIAS